MHHYPLILRKNLIYGRVFMREPCLVQALKQRIENDFRHPPPMNSLEALSDLYRTISDEEGEKWLEDISGMKKTLFADSGISHVKETLE